MNIIICLDTKNGMAFNRRRQSRDRCVIADMEKSIPNAEILASSYSKPLFEGGNIKVKYSDNYLDLATDEDYCFVEREQLCPYKDKISTVTVYRWDKAYPADVTLDLPLDSMKAVSTAELEGYSHKKIIKEIYTK